MKVLFSKHQRLICEKLQFYLAVISISKTRKKKEVIGWFTMGKEATGLEEIEHWEEMMEKKEEKSTHYHLLTF